MVSMNKFIRTTMLSNGRKGMDSKVEETAGRPLRTSDRLRQRRKPFGHAYLYYAPKPKKRSKPKRRADATRIAKILRERNQPTKPSVCFAEISHYHHHHHHGDFS